MTTGAERDIGGHPRVAAVVLAAGMGTRFGGTKQLAELNGRTLVQHAVDTAAQAGLEEVVVVLGHRADEVEAALELPPHGRVVANPEFASGMSSSLRAGLAALGDDVDAALVLLGDQPTVTPPAVRAVVQAQRASHRPIARARYGAASGHPVVLARSVWAEVAAVSGDRGARDIVAADPGRVLEVEIGTGPPPDVDTSEDHAALRRRA